MEEKVLNLRNLLEKKVAAYEFPAEPELLYEPIRYFLGIGGKRIRPLLVLLGCEIFAPEKIEEAIPAALAIEFFHNFTLLHDDIMDQAALRRGVQTVHTKWDSNVAILSGDNLLIHAYQQLAMCSGPLVPELLREFNTMAKGVCEGQQWDMDFEKLSSINQTEYFRMIEHKTSVLLGAALKIGSIIGGASTEEQDIIYRFGVNLGMAFQIQDDILDLYGHADQVGKQIGGDILANKKTILYIAAFEQASESAREELQSLFWNKQHSDSQAKIARVREIFADLNVLERVTEIKGSFVDKAYQDLERLQVPAQRLETLRNLAQILLTREK